MTKKVYLFTATGHNFCPFSLQIIPFIPILFPFLSQIIPILIPFSSVIIHILFPLQSCFLPVRAGAQGQSGVRIWSGKLSVGGADSG